MQGCGISSAKEGLFLAFTTTTEEIPQIFYTYKHLSLHDPMQDCGIFIVNALEISQFCTFYLTTV